MEISVSIAPPMDVVSHLVDSGRFTSTVRIMRHKVTELDVLCGKGRERSQHLGNRRFVAIIANHADQYCLAGNSRSLKTKVVEAVLLEVRSQGSRFFNKQGGRGRKEWVEIRKERIIRDKVGHALRDSFRRNYKDVDEDCAQSSDFAHETKAPTLTDVSGELVCSCERLVRSTCEYSHTIPPPITPWTFLSAENPSFPLEPHMNGNYASSASVVPSVALLPNPMNVRVASSVAFTRGSESSYSHLGDDWVDELMLILDLPDSTDIGIDGQECTQGYQCLTPDRSKTVGVTDETMMNDFKRKLTTTVHNQDDSIFGLLASDLLL